mmetsp:Transcript_21542/g.48961  ORF Transcript_21542/g.48961 Transcript_21542/m.48961 type:complete len:515 (-) Transcript_21542:134-1678(-)
MPLAKKVFASRSNYLVKLKESREETLGRVFDSVKNSRESVNAPTDELDEESPSLSEDRRYYSEVDTDDDKNDCERTIGDESASMLSSVYDGKDCYNDDCSFFTLDRNFVPTKEQKECVYRDLISPLTVNYGQGNYPSRNIKNDLQILHEDESCSMTDVILPRKYDILFDHVKRRKIQYGNMALKGLIEWKKASLKVNSCTKTKLSRAINSIINILDSQRPQPKFLSWNDVKMQWYAVEKEDLKLRIMLILKGYELEAYDEKRDYVDVSVCEAKDDDSFARHFIDDKGILMEGVDLCFDSFVTLFYNIALCQCNCLFEDETEVLSCVSSGTVWSLSSNGTIKTQSQKKKSKKKSMSKAAEKGKSKCFILIFWNFCYRSIFFISKSPEKRHRSDSPVMKRKVKKIMSSLSERKRKVEILEEVTQKKNDEVSEIRGDEKDDKYDNFKYGAHSTEEKLFQKDDDRERLISLRNSNSSIMYTLDESGKYTPKKKCSFISRRKRRIGMYQQVNSQEEIWL